MSANATSTTHQRRSLRAASAAALGLAAVFGVASPALAHDELIDTAIISDGQGAAESVQLTFNNSIVEVGTEFILESPEGADATDGAPEVSGPTVVQPIRPDLAPGDYNAAWRVVSSDGHPIEGTFVVIIAADGSAEIGERTQSSTPAERAEGGADDDAASNESVTPTGALIAVGIGGAAVIAAGLAIATAGRRRRTREMAAESPAAAEKSSDVSTKLGGDR